MELIDIEWHTQDTKFLSNPPQKILIELPNSERSYASSYLVFLSEYYPTSTYAPISESPGKAPVLLHAKFIQEHYTSESAAVNALYLPRFLVVKKTIYITCELYALRW